MSIASAVRHLSCVGLLALLAGSPVWASDITPAQQASVAKQLVLLAGQNKPGKAQRYEIRVAGAVLSLRAARAEDGSVVVTPVPANAPNPVGIRTIVTLVDQDGMLVGMLIDGNGDGIAEHRAVIGANGLAEPVDAATEIPGIRVTSATQLAYVTMPRR